MSAQALNGSSNGYSIGVSASNPSGSVPTRDASDITRQLKERLIYAGFKSSPITTPGTPNQVFQRPTLNPAGANHIPGNSEWSWLSGGNQFRLSYFFGRLKQQGSSSCSSCSGSLLDGNGPNKFNVQPGNTSNTGS